MKTALPYMPLVFLMAFATTNMFGGDISLDIEVHKTSIIIGEPLYITTHLWNRGTNIVSIMYNNGPSYNSTQGWGGVMISSEWDDFDMWDDAFREIYSMSNKILKPSDCLTNVFVVCAENIDNRYYKPAFRDPGKYEIKVEYLILPTGGGNYRDIEVLSSRQVQVNVLPPTSGDFASWRKLRDNHHYAVLVQAPWRLAYEVCNYDINCEAELDQAKGSIYAQYFALGIARCWLLNGNHDEAQKFFDLAKEAADNEFVRQAADRE